MRANALDLITNHRRWPDFELSEAALADRIEHLQEPDAAAVVRAFYETYAEAQGKSRWGEKTPQYLRMMGRIARTLPEARFVHIIRDGRDVALSLLSVEWGPTTVTAAAEQWVDEILTARRKIERMPHYMEVRFEQLVSDPEPLVREVSGFVELPFEPAMLAYHQGASGRMGEMQRDFEIAGGPTLTPDERVRQHALVSAPPQTNRGRSLAGGHGCPRRRRLRGHRRRTCSRELGYELANRLPVASGSRTGFALACPACGELQRRRGGRARLERCLPLRFGRRQPRWSGLPAGQARQAPTCFGKTVTMRRVGNDQGHRRQRRDPGLRRPQRDHRQRRQRRHLRRRRQRQGRRQQGQRRPHRRLGYGGSGRRQRLSSTVASGNDTLDRRQPTRPAATRPAAARTASTAGRQRHRDRRRLVEERRRDRVAATTRSTAAAAATSRWATRSARRTRPARGNDYIQSEEDPDMPSRGREATGHGGVATGSGKDELRLRQGQRPRLRRRLRPLRRRQGHRQRQVPRRRGPRRGRRRRSWRGEGFGRR